MRGGSIRVFLLASLGAHCLALSLLPRDPPGARRRAGTVRMTPREGAIELQAIPTWSADPGGRARALLSWAEALAVSRSPMEAVRPGAPSRTDAALDLGAPGSGPGEHQDGETRLTDRDDRVAMSENVPNSLDEDQVQRIDTGEVRSTWDDRRATPHPGDDDWVASPPRPGDAIARNVSPADPARGDPIRADTPAGGTPIAAVEGLRGAPGDQGEEPLAAREAVEASVVPPGAIEARSGRPDGDDEGPIATEEVAAWQRPDVSEGSASVPAPVHDTRTRDNRNGRLWNSHFYRSYTDASLVSGTAAAGSGDGSRGSGRGLAGRGAGARGVGADRRGPAWISFRTGDPRYLGYFRQIHRRIDPLWRAAFPIDLRLSHDQGLVIIGFVLHRDGTVTGVRVLRQSGHPRFDANVVAAVEDAAPFLPIPSEISDDALHVSAPFHFSNPMF